MFAFSPRSEQDPRVENSRLVSLLSSIRPSQALVVSDMTGTLLFQSRAASQDGFPEGQREQIRRFLSFGGRLAVVTGDSSGTVREQLIAPLNYKNSNPYFLVTCSGYEILEVKDGICSARYRGKTMDADTKTALVRLIALKVRQEYDDAFSITDHQLAAFFRGDGCRFDLRTAIRNRRSTFFLEVAPNKVTVYFPDRGVDSFGDARFIGGLAEDPSIVRIAAENNLHIIAGSNYLDVISSSKREGLSVFLERFGCFDGLSERTVIVMGDSPNDEGIFNFDYRGARRVIRVFVGSNCDFIGREHRGADFVFLKDQFIEGSLKAFQLLNGER